MGCNLRQELIGCRKTRLTAQQTVCMTGVTRQNTCSITHLKRGAELQYRIVCVTVTDSNEV